MIDDDSLEPDKRREGAAPLPLDELLGQVVGQRGWSRRIRGARVHEHWFEIAGEQLARHTEPIRLHGGVLVLRVSSPSWATQVRYLAGPLLERANAVLGAGSVERIQVVSGGSDGRSGRRTGGR